MSTDKHGDPLISEFGRLTPDLLLDKLSSRIQRRTRLIADIYSTYLGGFSGIYLNRRLLYQAIESGYCDIYRLKFFRQVEWIDIHKKAAYTMKWIARIRPVQVHSGADITKTVALANAYFAVVVGLTLMEVNQKWSTEEWWKRYVRNLTYLLHYHSVSVEQLSSELYVLERCNTSTPRAT